MAGKPYENFFFYGFFAASLLGVLGGWVWAWTALQAIQSPLILHFSDYTGINHIGGMAEIHGLAMSGLTITIVNFVLAWNLKTTERRWALLLAGATLVLAALLFTALAAIISVNQ